EEIAAGLSIFREVSRFDFKGARGVSLVDRDLNAADPGIIHAHVGHHVSPTISHGDIHGLTNFPGLLLRRVNHAARVFQRHCRHNVLLLMGNENLFPMATSANSTPPMSFDAMQLMWKCFRNARTAAALSNCRSAALMRASALDMSALGHGAKRSDEGCPLTWD